MREMRSAPASAERQRRQATMTAHQHDLAHRPLDGLDVLLLDALTVAQQGDMRREPPRAAGTRVEGVAETLVQHFEPYRALLASQHECTVREAADAIEHRPERRH